MVKLCIWMNIPSHYQSAFFKALNDRDDVDLQVVYLNPASEDRAAEGWHTEHDLQPFEMYAVDSQPPAELLTQIPKGAERTHIISAYFSTQLIDWFCAQGIDWCHWSEMPGIRLAELLGYRMALFRILNPMMLACKRAEGRLIRKYAVGAFGQGALARRAFRVMGVPDKRIADLYYTPSGLLPASRCEKMHTFAAGRKIFLAVGALGRRKGIDVLLKAFAELNTNDWCVVLCGLDRAEGCYQQLAEHLGIQDRVLFLGAYAADRIAEVYSAADVFVLPSRFDGWGAVLNEAASLGLPLIGTDLCGGSWHLIDEGKNGYRVKAGSVTDLRGAMTAYVNAPEMMKQHGEVSRLLFEENFTAECNAERLVGALNVWQNL